MMDDKIRLPDFIIAELYKDSLVALEDAQTVEPPQQPAVQLVETPEVENKIRYLGSNNKRVTIIVDVPETAFLPEDDLAFLTNILKACQLSLGDIAIVNLAQQQIVYETLKTELQPTKILLFDVEPSAIKLPFMIPSFQLQRFDDCQVMVAPPLLQLSKPGPEGKLLKTKLWLALKQIFNIP